MALTIKQITFIVEYLKDGNATRSAIAAGYSEKTAQEQGARLLSNVMVKEELAKRFQRLQERTEITADYVLNGIKTVAENTEKDNDKLKAYELLGKYLKLFTDRLEVEASDDMAELLKARREKVSKRGK